MLNQSAVKVISIKNNQTCINAGHKYVIYCLQKTYRPTTHPLAMMRFTAILFPE